MGDKGEVLLSQGEDGDLRDIDLLLPGQGQQQVDRPFETIEVKEQLTFEAFDRGTALTVIGSCGWAGGFVHDSILTVSSQPGDEFQHKFSRNSHQPTENIDIQTKRAPKIGQQKDRPDQDKQPIRFKPGKRRRQSIGQQADGDPTAIQWRQRNKIKYCQYHIDNKGIFKV